MRECPWCMPRQSVSKPGRLPRRTAGISRTSWSSARPATAAFDGGFGRGRIADQTDEDFGARFIGDDVGRASAVRWCRCSGCWRPEFHRRATGRRGRSPGRRAVLDGRVAELGISGVRHASAGNDLVAERAFRTQRQLVAGGLAVDQKARATRMPGGMIARLRCCVPRRPRRAARSPARRLRATARPRESWTR